MAAAGDPWHLPLRSRDLKTAQVQVFLVGQMSPLRSIGELQVAREGLLARRGPRSGVILPGEARTASWALREARRKAGLRPSERADLFRFSAICWREPKCPVTFKMKQFCNSKMLHLRDRVLGDGLVVGAHRDLVAQ
jgi:AMMECR1 domain-containing protein